MAKVSAARTHVVRAEMKVNELTRAGSSLTLNIFASNRKIGQILIGRGSLYWYGGRRKKAKRISWSRFAQMMDDKAYKKG